MIIYLNQSGRFGHQLSMFVALYIYSTQYNIPFCYPLFVKRYLPYIEQQYLNNSIVVRKINIFRNMFMHLNLYILKYFIKDKSAIKWKTKFPFLDTAYSDKLVGSDVISELYSSEKNAVTNYLFIDTEAFIANRSKIKQEIRFNPKTERLITEEFDAVKKNGYTVICLHIRQTDFREFLNGKYYFDIHKYLDVLEKSIKMINAKYYAYICCDEELNIDSIHHNFTNLRYKKRSFMEDFLILKNSDYIISTRSAFSMMACYFGNNKIYQIIANNAESDDIEFLDYETLVRKYYHINQLNNRISN